MEKKVKRPRIGPILIGCDPELELLDQLRSNVIQATNLAKTESGGQIGRDGSGDQVELRPNPGTPGEVTKNLKMLIRTLTADNYFCGVKGDKYPLGGHIHISGLGPCPGANFIAALDHFIGVPMRGLSGTARGYYGSLGEYRSQPHGGIEYRTPPSAWLAKPEYARLVLRIAYQLAKRVSSTRGFSYETDDNRCVATAASVAKLIGPTSARKFIEFCHAPVTTDPINAAWTRGRGQPVRTAGLAVQTPGICLDVIFRDEWQDAMRVAIQHALAQIPIQTRATVELFGLAIDRGQVCYGTDIPGLVRIADDVFRRAGIQIGISYDWRMQLQSSSSAAHIDFDRVALIVAAIRARLGSLVVDKGNQ